MKTNVYYFLIQTPQACMTYIGGPLKLSKRAGYVLMTNPGGEPVFEVPRAYVTPATREQLADRILADARARQSQRN